MDLLSSIRKSGSRGGVNFSWDEVSTSQHRENYLGHSVMAPVGRWQKGRDLTWYTKGDDKIAIDGETAEDKKVRERKEEIRRIKEAEEDALARALGLPVAVRGDGEGTGANRITIGEIKKVIKETEAGDDEIEEVGKGKGFSNFVGKMDVDVKIESTREPEKGGLMGRASEGLGDRQGRKGEGRKDRSRSRERRHRMHRHRSRSGERYKHRHRDDGGRRKDRGGSPDRRERRHRARSADRLKSRRDDREPRTDSDRWSSRRSRSPQSRDHRDRRDKDSERWR